VVERHRVNLSHLECGLGEHTFCPFSGVPRELSAFITAIRKGGPVPRALSATEALVDLKVVEAICDAAAAKSAAGTRVAA
jgi:predicted dehydrogenase